MARTLLEMVRQAAGEIGIPQPQSLFGNLNDTEQQLITLANREAKEFSGVANKNGGWQELHKEYVFDTAFLSTTGDLTAGSAVVTNIPSTAGLTANFWGIGSGPFDNGTRIVSIDGPNQVTLSNVANETQIGGTIVFGKVAYDLPSDFEYFVDKTFWDNRYKWALIGPITAQEKQILRYGVVASGPRNKFYVRINKMWLDPVPSEKFKIAYDYFSNARNPACVHFASVSILDAGRHGEVVIHDNRFILTHFGKGVFGVQSPRRRGNGGLPRYSFFACRGG